MSKTHAALLAVLVGAKALESPIGFATLRSFDGVDTGIAQDVDYGFVSVEQSTSPSSESANIVIVKFNIKFTSSFGGCSQASPCVGGLAVHDGVSINDGARDELVGGHYYEGETDPWNVPGETNVGQWTSEDGDVATGSFEIDAGLAHATYADHTVVVTAPSGPRIGYGIFRGLPSQFTEIGHYPGSDDPLRPSGTVSITTTLNGDLQVAYTLVGLDMTDGAMGGLHVHTGISCTDAGGHFWFPNTAADPWNAVDTVYTTTGVTGTVIGRFTVADTGLNLGNMDGHAVVVHKANPNGATRIGCGTLMKQGSGPTVGLVSIGNYPENVAASVRGEVQISAGAGVGDLTVNYKLWFDEAGLLANDSGGLHIHKGVSCEDKDLVGGHYWDVALDATDPWGAGTMWTNIASDNNYSEGSFQVPKNFPFAAQTGHAVVVHNTAGARIGCGTIQGLEGYRAKLTAYPGYAGGETVSAEVTMNRAAGDTVGFSYALQSTELSATGGLHVHVGTTCATSGPHYWAPADAADPWTTITYTTDVNGIAFGYVAVDDGFALEDHKYHAVVAHLEAGDRVACGTLDGDYVAPIITDAPSPATTKAPTGKLSSASTAGVSAGAVLAAYTVFLL